jgi:hypothetical protein
MSLTELRAKSEGWGDSVAYNSPSQKIPRRESFLRVLILRFRIIGRGRQRTNMSRETSRDAIVIFQYPRLRVVWPNSSQKLEIGVAEKIADC